MNTSLVSKNKNVKVYFAKYFPDLRGLTWELGVGVDDKIVIGDIIVVDSANEVVEVGCGDTVM